MPRIVLHSRATKRQAVKQKHGKDDAVIAKTRRLTDFFEKSCSTESDHSAIDEEDVTSLSAEMVKLPSASNIDYNVAETYVAEVHTSQCQKCQKQKKYWVEVFRRVVAVVTLLAERGLPFRGDDETHWVQT